MLVEGGAKTAAGMMAPGKVNDVALFFAPGAGEQGHPRAPDWARLQGSRVSLIGAGRDLCLRGTLKGAK